MGKRMNQINKQYLGKPVVSVSELNEEMESLNAYAVVRKIQMVSFDEDESDGLYIYRINGTKDAMCSRKDAKQLDKRVYQISTYHSMWPF